MYCATTHCDTRTIHVFRQDRQISSNTLLNTREYACIPNRYSSSLPLPPQLEHPFLLLITRVGLTCNPCTLQSRLRVRQPALARTRLGAVGRANAVQLVTDVEVLEYVVDREQVRADAVQ